MSAAEPWTSLLPGERFHVKSRGGNPYELGFIFTGGGESGFFARFGTTGKVARFYPERLDWASFAKLLPGPITNPGDEILLSTRDGRELRGRVLGTTPEHMSLRLSTDALVSVKTGDVVRGSVRLVFAATDWRAGDEFLVKSKSGRDYRGTTVRVSADRIEVLLQGRVGASGETVTLRVDQLDVSSFRVLVPLGLSTMAPV